MAEYYGTTVADIFKTQTERFRVEGAEGVDAVFAYDISGDGGGRWKVTVRDKKALTEKVDDGDLGDFSVKLSTDAETFVGISIGKVDGTEAFTGGKLRVEGDMALMGVLPRLFVKYTPPGGGVTAQDVIASLPERFRPDRAGDLEAAIGYDITGGGGGKWTAVVSGGKVTVEDGLRDDLSMKQTVSAKDFVDLVLGKLDPMVAIGGGRLRISGDMEVAAAVPKIFAKFEPKGAEKGPELIVLKKTISVDMRYATGPVMGRFLEALKEKKILANVCPECGRKQLPPREVCAVCRCRVDDFREVGPEGTIELLEHTYYASPDPLTGETRETPYGIIHVLLDGCSGTETLWHLIKPSDLGSAKVGDRVRPVWAEKRNGSIFDMLYFEKVD